MTATVAALATAAAVLALAARFRPPPRRVLTPPRSGRPVPANVPRSASRKRQGRRHLAALEADVPEVVDLLAMAVGAGLTVPQALQAVARRARGPLATVLGSVLTEAARGRRLADAIDDLPARAGEPTRPVAAALAACERYGAPVRETLDRLAVEARERQRRRAETAARRVPVLLLFPLVTCILPAFALLAVAPLLADAVTALRL